MVKENQYRDQIDRYIESKKEEMLKDLGTLVRIDSQRTEASEGKPFGDGPARVLDEALKLMSGYGLKVTDYDHYAVTGDYGNGEKVLDILAHLDVVPVSDEWTVTAPFEPKIVDGRIYGRGTSDNKGPAVAALYAIRAVKDLGIGLSGSVRLILGSDEECGSSDLKHYYSIEKEAPYTFTPDADFPVINLEKGRLALPFTASAPEEGNTVILSFEGGDKVNVVPQNAHALIRTGTDCSLVRKAADEIGTQTGVTIRTEEKDDGILISVRGTAAHGSTPELGCNAVTALLRLLSFLMADEHHHTSDLIKGLDRLFRHGDTKGTAMGIAMQDEKAGELTMNLGILKISDGRLYGEFDIRAPLCANDDNLTAVVRKNLAQIGIKMEDGKMKKPHYVPEDLPFIRILLESYEHYTGEKGECLSTGGGTYVHDLERGVAFGCTMPGEDTHMHGDDEFMEISSLLLSAKIFADVIVKMCS